MRLWTLSAAIAFGVALAFSTLAPSQAKAESWSQDIQVYNPACTSGDDACWAVAQGAGLEIVTYTSLEKADAKHHICGGAVQSAHPLSIVPQFNGQTFFVRS